MYTTKPLFSYAAGYYAIFPPGLPSRFYEGDGDVVFAEEYVICFQPNTPEDIKLKVVTSDGNKTFADRMVKENVTKEQVEISGKGTVTVEIYVKGELKKTVSMNLNEVTEKTIDANT